MSKIKADTTSVLIGYFFIMKAKIDNLEKEELVEMVKILFVEIKLRHLDMQCINDSSEVKEEAIETLMVEVALNVDELILTYFGHNV